MMLRTLLFVPGARRQMLDKAPKLGPDGFVLDLEDSVAEGEKVLARQQVRDAIPSLCARDASQADKGGSVWVRINSTYSGRAKDDIRAVLQPGVTGIVLPKADSPDIVRYADALLRDAEASAGVEAGATRLIAAIESAKALLRVAEIARASTRLAGLAFGAEDYTADMQMERTPAGDELMYARHTIAVAARASGLPALDTVFPFLHDLEALLNEARVARRAGFAGKLLIHPEQIEPVTAVFTPSQEELVAARRRLEAYEQAGRDGRGATELDGVMVDAPVARRARDLLELAGELPK